MIGLDKLKNIDTPARYIGGEARQCIKKNSGVTKRMCVAVPAIYEFGMFDFDLKDIYYTLNNNRNIWCERAFAPMLDFEKLLKVNNEKLYTLESKTPLKNMDGIVFVLSSELMYTNMLNMLNLGGIPILKERRSEEAPLVIATGSSILNPKPLEKFVDLYIIGEAALVIENIVNKIDKRLSKQEMLNSMKDTPGVYIPGITDGDVYMVRETDIDRKVEPKSVVIPLVKTIMDKSVIRVSSGCDKNCIMCAHKYAYGTPQYISVDRALLNTKRIVDATGNTQVAIMSNCYAAYPGFPEIIYRLNDLDKPKIKEVSFMDVKLNKDNLWLLKHMDNKEEYPSIIVGAPTKELRHKLGIEIQDEDVIYIAKEVFKVGFSKIRLKYIIGVPGETYEDFHKILNLADKVCKVYKEVYSKSPDKFIVEVNLYNFKVSPHTPSQWCAVNTSENLELKVRYINEKNRNENVIITSDNSKQSVIANILSRGDEKIADVVYEAWKQGARHDMMAPLFSGDSWNLAFNITGVDMKNYIEQLNEKKLLPWDNIMVGTPKEELRRIYINNVKGDSK